MSFVSISAMVSILLTRNSSTVSGDYLKSTTIRYDKMIRKFVLCCFVLTSDYGFRSPFSAISRDPRSELGKWKLPSSSTKVILFV